MVASTELVRGEEETVVGEAAQWAEVSADEWVVVRA
jgi:hypothetical protein